MSDGETMDSTVMDSFRTRLEKSLADGTWARLILGKYRGTEPELRNVVARPVQIKGELRLTLVYRYQTRDVTRTHPVGEAMATIMTLLGGDFRSAHLFTAEEALQLEFNKKGTPRMSATHLSDGGSPTPSLSHDDVKERLIEPSRPFLAELGITRGQAQVLPSMSRKWKQINVFLERFREALAASTIDRSRSVKVVDFGSGKGYLTFAVHDYLANTLRLAAEVTGVEQRAELVRFCAGVAGRVGAQGLAFHDGDLSSCPAGELHVVIALHACDTATDQAIRLGVERGAAIIMCAPCCHKEVRPRMVVPAVLKPLLKHGIHLGQEAEMVTDALRALWLEACGYDARVFEFISPEHTGKNKMILAVRRAGPSDPGPALTQMRQLAEFYGIRSQALLDAPPVTPS